MRHGNTYLETTHIAWIAGIFQTILITFEKEFQEKSKEKQSNGLDGNHFARESAQLPGNNKKKLISFDRLASLRGQTGVYCHSQLVRTKQGTYGMSIDVLRIVFIQRHERSIVNN
jgi:hypothetical protein